MKLKTKKALSLVLALVFVIALLPGTSLAVAKKTVSSVAVVDGGDGFTPVTAPVVGQVLAANVTLTDGTVVGTYPKDDNISYKWHYKDSDTVLGTDGRYTVTSDNMGKTICVTVAGITDYNGNALWEATRMVGVYNITFNANGGTVSPTSMMTKADGKLDTLPIPTKTHYTFNGWFTALVGGTKLDLNTVYTKDSQIYAQWSPIIDPDPTPSGGGGGIAVVSYAVTLNQSTGGTIKADKATATAGTTVNLTVELTDGYALTGVTARTAAGATVAVTGTASGWSFTMPAAAVTVSAAFEVDDHTTIPFTDVASTAWYAKAVEYVYGNRLMDGTGAATFSPDAEMTRVMVWTVLARKAGQTISGSDWNELAKSWAVSTGTSDGTSPTTSVSRDMLITMLYRFAKANGYDVTAGGTAIREFSDHDLIEDWAMEAMTWAVNVSLVQGSNNMLMPTKEATRAEFATILMNFDALKK